MKILNCGYYEAHDHGILRCIFDVEDVEETYIQKAKEYDEFYDLPCFELEILYNKKDKKILNPADLVYIDFNGDACLFDYWLAVDQQEHIIDCIRKEVNI